MLYCFRSVLLIFYSQILMSPPHHVYVLLCLFQLQDRLMPFGPFDRSVLFLEWLRLLWLLYI